MCNKFVILSILLLFLMVFGCVGGSQPQEKSGSGTSGTQDSGQAQEANEGTSGSGGQEDASMQTSDGPEESEEQAQPGIDIGTQTCFALMGSGIPVECTMSVLSDGETTTTRFYMKGDGAMRHEIETGSEDCTKMVVITKDNKIYMGCEGQKYMGTSCDWYLFELEAPSSGTPSTDTEADSYDYSSAMKDLPTTQCSCMPWLYNAGKFQVSGKVCDQEQMMQDLINSANTETSSGS